MPQKQDHMTHLGQEPVEMLCSEQALIAEEGSSLFLVRSLTPACEPNPELREEGEDRHVLWLSNELNTELHI